MIEEWKNVVIVAPHPDDEVLGVGGTAARLAASGVNVRVVIVTRVPDESYNERNRYDARAAHAVLGIVETCFLEFPAAKLDGVPHHELNAGMDEVLSKWESDAIFLPFPGDIHRDHKLIFESCMVALRPNKKFRGQALLCYETLSETNWSAPFEMPGFRPNVYISIDGYLDRKLEAFTKFSLQVQEAPHERSIEALRTLAMHRGMTVSSPAAESFMLVRQAC